VFGTTGKLPSVVEYDIHPECNVNPRVSPRRCTTSLGKYDATVSGTTGKLPEYNANPRVSPRRCTTSLGKYDTIMRILSFRDRHQTLVPNRVEGKSFHAS
jgi:hypothetical protein